MPVAITTPTIPADDNSVSALEVRNQLGQLLDKAYYRHESFVVERAGKPLAAIVPMSMYRSMQQARARFFAVHEELKASFAHLSEKAIDKLVNEAVTAVRAKHATKEA